MFQRLISRIRNSSPLDTISEPPSSPRLERIIVPKSAYDAADTEPYELIGAIVTYVNHLITRGRFTRDEVPQEALQAYHVDYYLAQVNNGGHAQFIGNSIANLSFVLTDVGRGLQAVGAHKHRALFGKMQSWVARNPREVAQQTGFQGGIAPELAALDAPFFALEAKASLTDLLAQWIKHLPNLQVVDDKTLPQVLNGVISLNPELDERTIAADIARIAHQLSDELHVGFGLVTASKSPPEPIVHLGGGTQMEIEPGREEFAFTVRTVAADRYCLRTENSFELYEKVEADNAHLPEMRTPKDLENVSLDDILAYQAPKVGARLSSVPQRLAEIATLVCSRFQVAAAIDLLLRSQPDPSRVTFASIRSVGKGQDDKIGTTILVVADDGTRAYSVIVEGDGAQLLAEPSHAVLDSISRLEIDAHAKAHSVT